MSRLLSWFTVFTGLVVGGIGFADEPAGIPFRDLTNRVPGFEVKLWTDRANPVYAVGEKLRIQAKSNRDCFLYVFHISPTGKCRFLGLNEKSIDFRATANQLVKIPGDKLEIVAVPPVGAEVVLVIATTKPIGAEAAGDDRKLRAMLQELGDDLKVRHVAALKDFVLQIREEQPNAWVGSYLVLTTVEAAASTATPSSMK